ncbi:flagellar assembly peptidoglycan hydrolase FlgJ [Rhodocyclus tenuis]|uniref:flagellar assembly peptidoglycan hydrolase FlgJ n=1 Tax=Rhodocyclus gracilis TaxID=2929842 RepID=UPI001298A5C0|nr:flagellar assembly peptidoglycan hydrolase FlgJ [Rhodocyclus gracilis]MRD73083.1 flagellar assembly peptidoglycan hydrolase FlgJ [Rhodocyclus gracilis]
MKSGDLDSQRFVLDVQAAADLRAKLKQNPQAGLKEAAQQFEGMLLQMMLKSMRDATPQDGLFDSDQSRFYTSILDQQLAQNLSANGKLGFARLIEQQLGRGMNAATLPTSETPGAASLDSSLESLQQALLSRQAAKAAASAATVAGAALGTDGAASAVGGSNDSREFARRVWPYAKAAADAVGVPAQFVVAHAALESAWGKSEIRAADGSPSYNLFGVKAGRSWQGATADVPTTEYVNGVAETTREKFRVYGSYAEAFQDYANLLRGSARFAGVLGQQDGARFASALQASGYATDPQYGDKLARVINSPTLRQGVSG